MDNKTIFALSTVYGKSGVAVIRISGRDAKSVFSYMTDIDTLYLKPRFAYFSSVKDIKKENILDKSLILFFK